MTVVGTPLSPYVRKVLFALDAKRCAYINDPLVPFYGNDNFTALSPLRRIPVLIFPNGTTVLDSRVICEYLDEDFSKGGGKSLLPSSAAERAHSRWIEEYASSRLSDVMVFGVWGLFGIERSVFQNPVDEAKAERVLNRDCPEVLSYVDRLIGDRLFLFGDTPLLADVALSQPIVNGLWVRRFRESPNVKLFPRVFAFVERVNAHLQSSLGAAERLARLPVEEHRTFLQRENWPLTDLNLMQSVPRRGIPRSFL